MIQNQGNVSPMSNEGRNVYVIEHITDAMIKLLHEKPMEDISISELCDLAGIGRASFYRNFSAKEDILKRYICQIFSDEVRVEKNIPISNVVQLVFKHFENHRKFYDIINQRGLVLLIKDAFIGLYGITPTSNKVEAYAKAFVAYSLYGWIEIWFQRGMTETSEELAEMFHNQGL